METSPKKKWSSKENPILKTWKKMKSLGHMSSNKKNKTPIPCSSTSSSSSEAVFMKSRSWHCSALQSDPQEHTTKLKNKKDRTATVAPHGCFTVYVGPKKQRFVVKTKLVNHPLFRTLLEDAETEYGYRSEGPIVLPCEVDFFLKVLAEMESVEDEEDDDWTNPPVCGLCSPYRSYGDATDSMAVKRYGSYKLLRTPTMLKMNSA